MECQGSACNKEINHKSVENQKFFPLFSKQFIENENSRSICTSCLSLNIRDSKYASRFPEPFVHTNTGYRYIAPRFPLVLHRRLILDSHFVRYFHLPYLASHLAGEFFIPTREMGERVRDFEEEIIFFFDEFYYYVYNI